MAQQDAIQDENQVPALIVVQGTAGTSDVEPGTSITMRVGGNAATGAMYVHDLSGAAGTTNITGTVVASNIITGTQATLGTVGVVNSGSVVITNGTIGDLDTVGTVGVVNSGSIVMTAGTVTTLNTVGTVGVLNAGSVVVTAGTIGDLDTVGTVGVLNAGSVVVTNGTTTVSTGSIVVTSGTIGDLDTVGTVGVVNAGSVVVTLGTVLITNGSVVQTAGTVTTGSIVVTAGSTVQTAGTLTTGTIQNVNAGTITALGAGTITAGTVRQQWQPVNQVTSFGTLGTAAGSLFGTISAASGAGTKHIVSGLSIVVESGTSDVRILYGTALTGGSVLAAGKFVPSAGIQRDFNPPIESGTNSEITYHFVGAGTAYITVQYWKSLI